jgi:membrane-associated protease RseP (regulator of RpoE activity)
MRSLGKFWSGLPAILLLLGLTSGVTGRAAAAESPRAWLGVQMQDLDDDLREGMDYRGEGVLISGVVDGSPAAKAGVRNGDVLVSVNGRSVESSGALSDLIGEMRVGQTASLVVMRDRTRRTLSVRLGSRPDRVELNDSQSDQPDDLPRFKDMKGFQDMKDLKDLHGMDMEDMPEVHGDDHGDNTIYLRGLGMGRGRLGVRVEDLSADLAPYFDSQPGSGALVMEVMKDTPAEKAGLKAGDVITRIGDDRISDADDLMKAVHSASEGKVTIEVTRKGARRTFETELDASPLSWKSGDGRAFSMIGPRRFMLRHNSGSPDTPPTPGSQREELRQLREQIKQLQEKLDRMGEQD